MDKLHPDTEPMLVLITQTFVLCGTRTHDLWHNSQNL